MVNKSILITSLVLLLMLSFVFAQTSPELEAFIKKIAEKRGIPESDIINVTEVTFGSLPEEVNISEAADSHIGLFKIETRTDSDSYIITFSEEGFGKTIQAPSSYPVSFLSFGTSEKEKTSTFLKMSSQVKSSLENGYVMTRSGSITGISTSLNVNKEGKEGELKIIIYKNGEQIGLGNSIKATSSGMKKDYEIQSRDIVNFNAGDVISVYLDNPNKAELTDITTMVEITLNN